MQRTAKLVLGTTVAAVSGGVLFGVNKLLNTTLVKNKRYIRNFVRFNLNNNYHLLTLVEQMSPRDVKQLSAIVAKFYQAEPEPTHCWSAFQEAIQC